MANIGHEPPPARAELVDFYERNGVSWGMVDLIAVGPGRVVERLGEIAAILRLAVREAAPVVTETVVVCPPSEPEAPDRVEGAIISTIERMRGRPLSPREREGVLSRVSFRIQATLESDLLIQCIRDARPESAVVVGRAALYRASRVAVATPDRAEPGDIWAPHLLAVIEQAAAAAAVANCYVVLEVGQWLPTRAEYREALVNASSAVLGDVTLAEVRDVAVAAQHWHTMAASGLLEDALAALDMDGRIGITAKRLLRMRLYSAAGFPHVTRAMLEADPAVLAGLDPQQNLAAAQLAEAADADDKATVLLREALPQLWSREELEAALVLALRLRDDDLIANSEARLDGAFPGSPVLRRRRAWALVDAGDYAAGRRLLEAGEDPEDLEAAGYVGLLAEHLKGDPNGDPRAVVAAVAHRFPAQAEGARANWAGKLARDGRRLAALDLLLDGVSPDQRLAAAPARVALDVVQRGRIARDPALNDERVVEVVRAVIDGIALRPTDAMTRGRLARTLGPQVMGRHGAAILAAVVIGFDHYENVAKQEPRPNGVSVEMLGDVYEAAAQWFSGRQTRVLGAATIPPELLGGAPPDGVLVALANFADVSAGQLADESGRQALLLTINLATAVAPLASNPNDDLMVLRVVAIRLAIEGHAQQARDLAEQGLALVREEPARARRAWLAYADVYARLGNRTEALTGAACMLATRASVTWEDVWFETNLLGRLMRDLGLTDFARSLADAARTALGHLDVDKRFASRLATTEVQLALTQSGRRTREPDAIATLVQDAEHALRGALDSRDELGPAATALASTIHLAERHGVEIPASARAAMDEALRRLPQPVAELVRLVQRAVPDAEEVAAFARRIEAARYAEDVGYDLHQLVTMARRLLRAGQAPTPEVAIYATECLADLAIEVPAGRGSTAQLLVRSAHAPADAARELSFAGVAIVTLALGDGGLVRATVTRGDTNTAVVEPNDVFSTQRLESWARDYPYGYRDPPDLNVFYTSTAGLGVSTLPERAVVIGSTDLQAFPPNLLNVGNELAGFRHRLAAAPSLTWLLAARRHPFAGDGRAVAWIPTSPPEEGWPPLARVAAELTDSFERHAIPCESAAAPPDGLAGADLVVVAAHGGVADGGRYFRAVSDDDKRVMIGTSSLASALGGVGLVILFVCSGGRVDRHPEANAVVGLVRQLLDEGCRAVVAPPWPIHVKVPARWLPTFLDRWTSGVPVIDACFDANEAVRDAVGNDPGAYLAMSVYGDPLVSRTDTSGGASH